MVEKHIVEMLKEKGVYLQDEHLVFPNLLERILSQLEGIQAQLESQYHSDLNCKSTFELGSVDSDLKYIISKIRFILNTR